MHGRSLTVAVCSRNTLLREGIRRFLSAEKPFHVIDTSLHLEGAAAWVKTFKPDIILYQPQSLSDNVLNIVASMKDGTKTKIILLLEEFVEDFFIAAIQAGAAGCILTAATPEELTKAIYMINAGELWVSRNLFAKVMHLRITKKPKARASASNKLTNRELQIAELVSQGLSNKEIAAQLHISEGTVKSHLNQVFKKLHLNHRVQLALHFVKNQALEK